MSKVSQEDIIRAAIQLFNQNGYHATSMRDIAQAVDIQKPSLYHHFDSKEAILLAILEAGMDQLIFEVETIVRQEADCLSKLRRAIHAHAATIAGNIEGATVFLREDRGLGDAYLARYVEKRDRVEKQFRAILAEGIAQGEFCDTDVTIAAHALLGMVNWMTRWYRPEGRLSAEEISDIFCDLFLGGLQPRGPKR
jgi:AcrR family transcriptional regulator